MEEFFGGARERREAAIESNQQMTMGLLGSGDYRAQFFIAQSQRLLDKNVSPCFQGATRQLCV